MGFVHMDSVKKQNYGMEGGCWKRKIPEVGKEEGARFAGHTPDL